MKTIKLLCLTLFPLLGFSQGNDTLFYERFETGGASFLLNTSDLGGVSAAVGYNQWIINNEYTGGSGQLVCLGFPFTFNVNNTSAQPASITGSASSNYMHIVSDAAQTGGINNCNFLASDGICNLDEINFTGMTQDVNTIGYDSVSFSFLWLCSGGPNIYGEVYYSTDSGLSWNVISTPVSQYRNQSNWTQQTLSIPAFAQQNTLRFGFRFVNQQSNSANDPGFGIDEVLITANNAAPGPIAAFTTSNPELCESGCIDFFDMSTGSPDSWLWIFPGATTSFSNLQNPSQICYNVPGTYNATLIVTNASGTDTLTTTAVVVYPDPPIPLVTLSNDTLYTTPGYATYQWYFNGSVISGANDNFHVVLMDGVYTVEVSDTNGCTSVSDSLNFTTGLEEFNSLLVGIFPNPVTNILHIKMPVNKINGFIIYNYEGKEVISTKGEATERSVDVSELTPGIYLLRILTTFEKELTVKFMKQ